MSASTIQTKPNREVLPVQEIGYYCALWTDDGQETLLGLPMSASDNPRHLPTHPQLDDARALISWCEFDVQHPQIINQLHQSQHSAADLKSLTFCDSLQDALDLDQIFVVEVCSPDYIENVGEGAVFASTDEREEAEALVNREIQRTLNAAQGEDVSLDCYGVLWVGGWRHRIIPSWGRDALQ